MGMKLQRHIEIPDVAHQESAGRATNKCFRCIVRLGHAKKIRVSRQAHFNERGIPQPRPNSRVSAVEAIVHLGAGRFGLDADLSGRSQPKIVKSEVAWKSGLRF